MSEDWLEVTLQAKQHDVDALEDWLFESGALSVTLRDSEDDDDIAHAVLEPVPGEVRLWDEVTLVGLFAQDATPEQVQNALYLAAAMTGMSVPVHRISQLGDREWERAWMDNFRPMQFGERLWICPTEQAVPDDTAVTIRLDPGLAFGTGTHATTAQCLAWMGDKTKESLTPFNGQSIVDYGCGSGVLAIAGLMLGASEAWAVDIDEQAILATRTNAAQNNVMENIKVGQPDILGAVQVDVLLANILFKPLMSLADNLARKVKPGGSLVLSGILEEQIEPLRLRYNDYFEFAQNQVQDGWALMTAVRR
ncbi:MAG: 50S ribosomal protein L11 methyltransferase [Granulosicoccus sp.]